MDELMVVFGVKESWWVLDLIKDVRVCGLLIVFISYNMLYVFEVVDCIYIYWFGCCVCVIKLVDFFMFDVVVIMIGVMDLLENLVV